MSAIFNFSSLITVLLLFICTMTYVRAIRPGVFDGGLSEEDRANSRNAHKRRSGVRGFCWKASRIGERVSPYVRGARVFLASRRRAATARARASQVAVCMAMMAVHIVVF